MFYHTAYSIVVSLYIRFLLQEKHIYNLLATYYHRLLVLAALQYIILHKLIITCVVVGAPASLYAPKRLVQ